MNRHDYETELSEMETWDFIIILYWVTIILIVSVLFYLYLNNRNISKKMEQMQQKLTANLDTINQMKKSKEERFKELVEIQNKVDKMIKEDRKKM